MITVPDLCGGPVAVTILGMTSDEAGDLSGSGSAAPDCTGHGGTTAQLLVERTGGGDGRLRVVALSADDDRGDTCEGEMSVGAPGASSHLRFSIRTPNLEDSDFFLGSPAANPDAFDFATCHGHDQFGSYAHH